MKTIYIDFDYKCYLTDDGTMTAVETDSFDGKCQTYIEGYRFVPAGQNWVRPDGQVFEGEMVSPWKDSQELDIAQRDYERQLLIEYESNQKDLDSSYQEGINSI